MFSFLKNKLKEWVDKAKDKLNPEEILEETKPAVKTKSKEKAKKKEEKAKEVKKQKKEKIEKVDELIEKAKEESTKNIPLEYNIAVEQYTPDTEKIKEEIKEKQEETKQNFFSKIFKKKSKTEEVKEELKKDEEEIEKIEEQREKINEEVPETEKLSFLTKLKSTFSYKISEDDFNSLFDDLEMLLLENNVAMEATEFLKKKLSQNLIGKEIKKDNLESEIKKELKEALNEILIDPDDPLDAIKLKKEKPFVMLFFGINGTGKTTSIAKIAYLLKENKISVTMAAADTFRAASIEQISEHGKKLNIPVIKQTYNSDPAAVGFDAIKYAKAHSIDVVLIDTAGRMHTKSNLMEEMKKISRVTQPDLKIFVAESIAGNDAIEQAKTFHEAIEIDGSILSKADIDEKGGTILSISYATKKPIFYLGTGQNYQDLKLFNKQDFIKSLGL